MLTEKEKNEIVNRVYRLVCFGTDDLEKIRQYEHEKLVKAKNTRQGITALCLLFLVLVTLYVGF